MKTRQEMNVSMSALRPLCCSVAVSLLMAMSTPLYAAQAGPEGPSAPSSQSGAGEALPVQAAVPAPGGKTAPDASPALTPEQYNEMLQTLRAQVAQQRALLALLAQRAGTLPEAPAGASGGAVKSDDTGTPSTTAQVSAGSGPQNAQAPVTGTAVAPQAAPQTSPPGVTEAAAAPGATEAAAATAPGTVTPATPAASAPSALQDDPTFRQAYASGVSVWREIQNSVAMQQALGIHLDPQQVLAGLEDSARGRTLKLSEQAITDAMSSLNADYQSRASEERLRQEAEGKAWRVAFSKEKGSFSDAGAWYRILSKGAGRHLSVNDMVQVKVSGTLPDGSVFDASGSHDQVRQVKVGALLPSVAIGLQKIGVGGHIMVVVPPAKGYGDTGLPPSIPGGATLIFDIEVKGFAADADR